MGVERPDPARPDPAWRDLARLQPLPARQIGLIGLAVGLVAARRRSPVLAVLAGACALAAGLGSRPPVSVPPVPAPRHDRRHGDNPRSTASQRSAARRAATDAAGDATSDSTPDPAAASSPFSTRGRLVSPNRALTPATPPSRLRDPETNLFTDLMFPIAVETRVSAARRHLRPVAVLLVRVVTDDPSGPGFVATTIRTVLRESDLACRLADGRFALILDDTPENGAVWTVERLRRALTGNQPVSISGVRPAAIPQRIVVHAGIACYPAHSFEPGELIQLAEAAFNDADDWVGDRIEVAEGMP